MRINGNQIFLAAIVILVLAALLFYSKITEANFFAITGTVVGYYFGSARGFVVKNNQKKKEGG